MTEVEIREWCARLGKTPEQQAQVIRDLLRHARSDEMSADDRTICVTQLQRLDEARSAWRRFR